MKSRRDFLKTSLIGGAVYFGAPKDVEVKGGSAGYGIIVDEIWAEPEINSTPPREPAHTGDWGTILSAHS